MQSRTLENTVTQLSTSSGTGLALIIGLATALWSASGYVGSFGRAMNRIYEVGEGRPVWKLRPVMLLVTLITVVLAALVALALVLTGPAAQAVGNAIGLGSTAVLVWNIAKWPVMLVVVIAIVALLYYATPNVKQPKFRWLSVGAVFAIVVWVLASAAFGFYVANFSSYNKTYGALAGVIVFLLWLWLTNLALLFGAELDAELERGRELQAGIAAEESVQLPPRDTKKRTRQPKKEREDIERGRRLRTSRGADEDIPGRPGGAVTCPLSSKEARPPRSSTARWGWSAASSPASSPVRSSSRPGSTPHPVTSTTPPRPWSRSTRCARCSSPRRPGRDLRGRQGRDQPRRCPGLRALRRASGPATEACLHDTVVGERSGSRACRNHSHGG